MTGNENGWGEYKLLVLDALKDLKELIRTVSDLKRDLAIIKVRYSLLGLIAGAIPVFIYWLVNR